MRTSSTLIPVALAAVMIVAGCGASSEMLGDGSRAPKNPKPSNPTWGTTTPDPTPTPTPDPTPTPTPTATGGFATVTVKTISGANVTVTLPQRTFNFTTAGHTYYVANSGSDSAAGTLSAPFATIPHALSAAVAGDIIYVRAGTYPPFTISKSGVSGKPLIVSSYPGEQARIIQPNGWQLANPHSPTVLLNACTYVWLHGFYIEGCMGQSNIPPRDEYGQNGVELASGAGIGCRILNNTITRAQHCGVKEMNHGGTQFLVEGNVIYENGVNNSNDHGIYIPSKNAIIRGNACFRNSAFGIHLYPSPSGDYVYNNVCFENGASGLIDAGNNNVWAYNVSVRNHEDGLYLYRSGCSYNKFENSIFASNVLKQIDMDSAGTTAYPHNNTIDYNDIYPQTNWATSLVASWCGSHQLFADPLFVDPANNNYQLQSGSPCLGKATPVTVTGAPASSNLGIFPATAYTDPI